LRSSARQKEEEIMTNMIRLICLAAVILVICMPAAAQTIYTTTMTSGPFLVAPTAMSIDWMVVNNDTVVADLRVTVYKLSINGGKEAVAPGHLEFSLDPGKTMHNANSVGSVFQLGDIYEVVVEATSDKVHPNVNQWSCNGSDCFIPGTLIPAGDFVVTKIKPPKP
jgi:hypothetical protein